MMECLRRHQQFTATSTEDKTKKRKRFFQRNKRDKTPTEDKVLHVKSFEKDLERAKVF